MLNYIFATTVDLFALTASLATFPVCTTSFDPRGQYTCSETPILLVHGYLHNCSAWLYVRHQLKKAGYHSVYTLNLGSPFNSIVTYAEKVRQKIRCIKKQTGSRQIRLIGHSMGGLTISYYATSMAEPGEVESIITLGSPLKGTKTGYLGFGDCANEMCYGSEFIEQLDQKIINCPEIRWLHLASKTDLLIIPHDSAYLEHPNAQCYVYECLGHVSYLYSPDVIRKIVGFYQAL